MLRAQILVASLQQRRQGGQQPLLAGGQGLGQHRVHRGELPQAGGGAGQRLAHMLPQGVDQPLHAALQVQVLLQVGGPAGVLDQVGARHGRG